MALQITTNINVDFYDNKYIMVNAKQYDDISRLISVTCYNQGSAFNLSAKNHAAYIKFKKADQHWVFNSCSIDYKGRVLVELTEQMLASSGICYVDLIIVEKGSAIVNIDTGDIVTIDGSALLTTKAFYIDVQEAVVDNSLIESVDAYDGLTDLLTRAEADYTEVIQMAKSYAVGTNNVARTNDEEDNAKYYSQLSRSYAIGDADDVRENEDTDNAKYYSQQSASSANSADQSETNAKSYMNTTKGYMNTTKGYMDTTKEHMDTANGYMSITKGYMDDTNEYMNSANDYMNASQTYMTNAGTSATNASTSEQNAKTSETNASTSEANAKTSETNALNSANLAQSYAVGGTGTRTNEDADNAKHYYNLVKTVVEGINNSFVPMGTISFSELATAEKAAGYVYNIKDDFVTTDDFAEGSGKFYRAGSNVYCRSDGLWDCFGGTASPVATVDEVKAYLGI